MASSYRLLSSLSLLYVFSYVASRYQCHMPSFVHAFSCEAIASHLASIQYRLFVP